VGNDPINKTDPTGMITVVHANTADMQEYQNAVSYLSSDPGAAADFAQLETSPDTYNIYVASGNPTIYDSNAKNIGWDPKEGLKVKGGVQSPALGLRHEVDHAAQHDKTGTAVTRASNGNPTSASKAEEKRAVKNETKTAKNLGEPTRSSHNQGQTVRVPNSTHSCVKTKTNPC
jgi:hypothetical protein